MVNDLKPFSPSIDWSAELLHSLWWLTQAWAITAAITMGVLVLLARFTTWGRQFWAVTGAYFTGRHSVKPWAVLAAMLLSVIVDVRLAERDSFVLEAGSHERSVRMKAADLVRLTDAQVEDIRREER